MRPADILKNIIVTLGVLALLAPLCWQPPVKTAAQLRLRMATAAHGDIQVYVDAGKGFSEALSIRKPIGPADGAPVDYTFDLPPCKIRAVRLDPLNAPGSATLTQVEILDAAGNILEKAETQSWHPNNEVASVAERPGGWEITTRTDSQDSSLEWPLAEPIDLRVRLWPAWGRFIGAGLGLFLAVVLIRHWSPLVRSLRAAQIRMDRHAVWTGLALPILAWLALLDAPNPPQPELDSSWQQIMSLAITRHWEFGRDIIFTTGPLSFLNQPFVLSETLSAKLLWEFFGKLILCLTLGMALVRLPWWRKLAVWALIIVYTWLFSDTFYLFLITTLLASWLMPGGTNPWKIALALPILVILSQVKFTYLLLASAGVLVAGAAAGIRREWWRALLLPLGYGVGFVLLWELVGQNGFRLPAYLSTSWEIATGYAWAMGSNESAPVFACGAITAVALGIHILLIMRRAHEEATIWGVGLVGGLASLLAWKHGFTRADGHVLGWFFTAILFSCTLPHWMQAKGLDRWSAWIIPVAMGGAWLAEPHLMAQTPEMIVGRIASTWRVICAPQAFVRHWHELEASSRNKAALPRLQSEVGQSTIDNFNYEQGILILNGLNYHPRPIPQGYSVYTPALQRINRAFHESTNAPEYYLWSVSTIDNRYPPCDDAPLWSDLPERYSLRFSEGEYALLKRETTRKFNTTTKLLFEHAAPMGADISLPQEITGRLWLKVTAAPSILGRARSLLYKPSELNFSAVDAAGREIHHRILPKACQAGFLVSPIVETQADLLDYMEGRPTPRLRNLRIEPLPGEGKYWNDAYIQLYEISTRTQ